MTDQREDNIEERSGDPSGDDDRDTTTERPDGWAGVDGALGGAQNRPAGPDYGAADTGTDDTDSDASTGSPREDDL